MDAGIGGIAVHIGARVASLAGPGEVLVSRTVKDLVAGSGLRFEDREVHHLKGVTEEWHLYRAGT
jgi:class 3 adenylate cyclase